MHWNSRSQSGCRFSLAQQPLSVSTNTPSRQSGMVLALYLANYSCPGRIQLQHRFLHISLWRCFFLTAIWVIGGHGIDGVLGQSQPSPTVQEARLILPILCRTHSVHDSVHAWKSMHDPFSTSSCADASLPLLNDFLKRNGSYLHTSLLLLKKSPSNGGRWQWLGSLQAGYA